MSGGQLRVPLTVRAQQGATGGMGAHHSQSLEAWFAHVPGLKVVMPATPADAKGLLLAAIDDPNPVIVLEHKLLYKQSGVVPEEPFRVPLGETEVRRTGRDLTIVATGVMVSRSLEAAEQLAAEGISASVLDPRTLRPLDAETIVDSVVATGRVLLVQEAPMTGGFMGEVAARIVESRSFGHLKAPVRRLCGLDVPIPYAPQLEQAAVPQVADVVTAGRELVRQW
jgi:acetoin:2,6-dichlorophenolindophenol oxidoreductase subunit beta